MWSKWSARESRGWTGLVSEKRSAVGCWVEGLTEPAERMGLREWDVGWGRGLERELEWLVLGVAWEVVGPDPHRSEDRPLHA